MAKREEAEIVREYGPFPGISRIGGVSFDGHNVWLAGGDRLCALDPVQGTLTREFALDARAGTAFDGRHLYQVAGERIQKIDPHTGQVISTIRAPDGNDCSGLAWAEGVLWLGLHRARKILVLDPESGAVLRTLDSPRFVTGVTFAAGELWHATWENDASELRRIDPQSGADLALLHLPQGVHVSGLESDGKDLFFCGGAGTGKVRAVRKPRR